METDGKQVTEILKQMMPVITFGIVMAYLCVLAIIWGLGVALAKGQGPSLAQCRGRRSRCIDGYNNARSAQHGYILCIIGSISNLSVSYI